MNPSIGDVLDRLDEIERELSELRLKFASLSFEPEKVQCGVDDFLSLHEEVSLRWKGKPSVLEEFRKSRGHDH